MIFVAALVLLRGGPTAVGGVAFHGPTTGLFLVPPRAPRTTELPATVIDEQELEAEIAPGRLRALLEHAPTWDTRLSVCAIGAAVLYFAGFDVPALVAWFSCGASTLEIFRMVRPAPSPEALVRKRLKTRYDPPPNATWTGKPSWERDVPTFVARNPASETLLVVDPSAESLLSGLFRGQLHVVVPSMDEFSLKKGLSEYFDLPETKGEDVLANLVKKGINEGNDHRPATVLVFVPPTATTQDKVRMFSDVDLLKRHAGDAVVTIVAVDDAEAVLRKAHPSLRRRLQVLS